MKKLLLTIFLIASTLNVCAQTKHYVYAEMCLSYEGVSLRVGTGYGSTDIKYGCLTDSVGKKIELKERADIFTYLGKLGWELIQSIPYGNSWNNYFILKKSVLKDDEAMKGIYFRKK